MKLTAILFVLLFAFSGHSQNYTLPVLSTIHDLPGSSFLVAHTDGPKIYIREIDENLGELWVDSLTFGSYVDSIYINELVQFGTTDRYLLTTKRVVGASYPNPSYLWSEAYNWDFQFSTFSVANQGFISSVNDTFNTINGFREMPFNDSLIYFTDRHMMLCGGIVLIPSFICQTYRVSANLDIDTLSSVLTCVPLTSNTLNRFGDELQWFFVHENDMKMMYMDTAMTYLGSVFEEIPTTIVSANPSPYSRYHHRINQDSILVLTEWITSSGTAGYWQLNFFSEDLNTINSINSTPPSIPNLGNYRIRDARLAGDQLAVLGVLEVPGVDHWTVFTYDLNMNLLCETSVTPWAALNTASSKSMLQINDKAYFVITDANKMDLFEIPCGTNAVDVLEKKVRFSLYPNPASEMISIRAGGDETIVGMSIVDLNGNLIREIENDVQEFLVEDLESGMYFLRIDCEGGVVCFERFLKE